MSSWPPAQPPSRVDAVREHLWLLVGARMLPITATELLIGSSSECDVIVDTGSEEVFARLGLLHGCVYIEDLGARMGVFVNEQRVRGRVVLFPSDRIRVGQEELKIAWQAMESSDPDPPFAPREQSQRPTMAAQARSALLSPKGAVPPGSRSRSGDPDAGLSTLQQVGRLADKMFAMGRLQSARSLLEGPLRNVLQKARNERAIELELLDTAGWYAVRLAMDTLDGAWIDLAVELHFIACRPIAEDTLAKLTALRAREPLGDEGFLVRYAELLRENVAKMDTADLVLCERIGRLLLPPGA